jgi:hypothetical protein
VVAGEACSREEDGGEEERESDGLVTELRTVAYIA